MFLYKCKNKCLHILKTAVFQGFSRATSIPRWPAHRRAHGTMWLGPIPLCKKSKHPHPGAQILSEIPEGGEGNRGQMPHICPGSPSPPHLSGLTLIDALHDVNQIDVFCSFFFLVYDTSSRETFDKLEEWLNEVEMYSTKKDIIKMLVGNKIDKVRETLFEVWLFIFLTLWPYLCLLTENDTVLNFAEQILWHAVVHVNVSCTACVKEYKWHCCTCLTYLENLFHLVDSSRKHISI